MKPGDWQALNAYVDKVAPHLGLDPRAVLAVSSQEGLSGSIGDNGTSFGPWQLHQGGAYPANAPQSPPSTANAWAWSKPGIDYALGRMALVAGGLKGAASVRAIVYRFERPANPQGEFLGAMRAYDTPGPIGKGGQVGGPSPPSPYNPVGDFTTGVGIVAKPVEAVAALIGRLLDPHFWLRALEVVGGTMLVLFGLYLLGRSMGVGPSGSLPEAALRRAPGGQAALTSAERG